VRCGQRQARPVAIGRRHVDLSAAGGGIAHLLSVRVLGCGGYRRVEREPHEELRWEVSPEGIGSIVSRQTRVATALVLVDVVIVGLPLLVLGPSGPVRSMALAVLVALVIRATIFNASAGR
jgi:hypothetical protein